MGNKFYSLELEGIPLIKYYLIYFIVSATVLHQRDAMFFSDVRVTW